MALQSLNFIFRVDIPNFQCYSPVYLRITWTLKIFIGMTQLSDSIMVGIVMLSSCSIGNTLSLDMP